MEKESAVSAETVERLSLLADDLEKIHGNDPVVQKLISRLRAGDEQSAKVFLANEMDKFDQYRKDAVPLIIEKLYGGSGSPWISVEEKMKKAREGNK